MVPRYRNIGRFVTAFTIFLVVTVSSLSAAEKVVLQLRWDHQFQFAGYYAALWRGYYRDAGLDVEIRSVFEPNGKFHNVINEVADGRADFGTGAIDILQARNGGIPLVVVASVFQQSPVAFYAKARTKLNHPADLTSLRVATRGSGGMAIAELRAMLRAEDIDPTLVKLQSIRERLGLFDLAKGNADVVSGFTISAGWVAREQGLALRSLRPSTYGVDFYGSALFTHQRLVDDNPELVQRFKKASMRGWNYALENPDEIVSGITKKLKRKIPIKDMRGFNAFQAVEVRKLTNFPIVQFGHTNPERWRKMHLALVDLGLAKGELQSASFIFDLEALKRRSNERNLKMIVVILGGFLVVIIVVLAWWRYRSVLQLNRILSESEKQFKGIFDNAGVGVAKTTPDGRFLLVNDRFVDIVGHNRDALLSHSFGEITHPEDRDNNLMAISEILAGSRQKYVAEKRYISAGGDTIWTTLTVEVVRDDNGSPEYLLAVIEDIGGRKQAENDRRIALLRAEEANQAKSDFLATMSHELRTPLNAIIGFSEMIEGQYFGALGSHKYSEYAHDIRGSSEYLLSLINDILDLSTIEAGRQNLTKEKLIVKELVADCVPIIARAASEKNVTFLVEATDNLRPLQADKRAVKQILINLLSNAVKYTPEGGSATFKVTVTDEYHVFEIKDSGIGIPAEKLFEITEPFVRTESDPHKAQEGTGLGLAIVKSLVNLHDGELDIKSEVGVGTTVTVRIPSGTT